MYKNEPIFINTENNIQRDWNFDSTDIAFMTIKWIYSDEFGEWLQFGNYKLRSVTVNNILSKKWEALHF